MFGQSKALNRIAASITAEDICTPFIFSLEAATKPRDAEQQWNGFCANYSSDPFDHLALVKKDGRFVGWAAYDSFGAGEETVEDAMNTLSVSNLLSAETPLLDTAMLYCEKSPWIFVVLKGNQPIGWISYYNLLGLAFRACLFGLILATEQSMADLLKTDSRLAVSKLALAELAFLVGAYGKKTKTLNEGGNVLLDLCGFKAAPEPYLEKLRTDFLSQLLSDDCTKN